MLNVHLDPALVALPNGLAQSADELQGLIERVISISEWLRECNAIRLLKLHDTESFLDQNSAFPSFESIKDVLQEFSLGSVFGVKDILVNLLRLLQRSENVLEVYGFEVAVSGLSGDDLIAEFARFPNGVRAASIQALSTMATLSSVKLIDPAHCFISGNPALKSRCQEYSIVVHSVVGTPPESLEEQPQSIRAPLRTIESPAEMLATGNANNIWLYAEDEFDIFNAIMARSKELAAGFNPVKNIHSFTIGSEFVGSLRNNQAFGAGLYSSSTLDTLARIVINEPKYQVSNFRGVRIDNYQGRRTHITKHPAIRLMFWQSAEGNIEFANIGQKDDLEIENGRRAHCVSVNYP